MVRNLSLAMISIIFFGSGVLHFTHDADLAAITPLPFAYPIVWVTGIMEFAFALFLWFPRYRVVTGLWLCVFCLAVLPANINMAINDLPMFGQQVDVGAVDEVEHAGTGRGVQVHASKSDRDQLGTARFVALLHHFVARVFAGTDEQSGLEGDVAEGDHGCSCAGRRA